MENDISIRFGVVGVGHLGNFHLKQLSKIPGIFISGIYDIDNVRAQKIGKKYNVRTLSTLENLLKSSDAVSIVTPTNNHYSIANQALESECHVFIEKPITDNLSDAGDLLKKADKGNKIIQVGHIERFNPAFLALEKKTITPHFIETHRLAPFNPRGNDVPVILDLMIHDLDIILSLVDSKIQDIHANGVKVASQTVDIANARLKFENGCVANLTASRISQKEMRKMRLFQKNNYVTIDFQTGILEEYKVCKDKPNNSVIEKVIEIGTDNKKYILYNRPEIQKHDALREELCHFIHSIKHSSQPETDGASATEALRLALEIQSIIDQ